MNRYSEKVVVRGSRFIPNTDYLSMQARPTGRILVEPSKNPYWVESGWEKTWDGYAGDYHVGKKNQWKGKIVERFGQQYEFFIYDPPIEIKRHPKGLCFSHKGGGEFQIHFHQRVEDINSGIIQIETILNEALNGRSGINKIYYSRRVKHGWLQRFAEGFLYG